MKKKLLTGIMVTAISGILTSVAAIDNSTRVRLLENAMIESAANPTQKAMVSSYMKSIAQEKLELAKSLRERAERPKAGKVVYKNSERKELLQRAAALEEEAKRYQNF